MSALHSSGEPGKVVLNYAEGGIGTLSARGVVLWRVQRMDMALVMPPGVPCQAS